MVLCWSWPEIEWELLGKSGYYCLGVKEKRKAKEPNKSDFYEIPI